MITLRTFKSKASTAAATTITTIIMQAILTKEGNCMTIDMRKEPDYK